MCPTGHIHVDVHVCDAHLDTYHMRMYTTHMFLYKKPQQFIYHYHMTPYLHTPTNATFKAQSSGHCALQKPHRKGSRYFFCILGEYVNLHVHFALVTWIDRLKSIYTIWNKIRIRYMFQVWLPFGNNCLGHLPTGTLFLGAGSTTCWLKVPGHWVGRGLLIARPVWWHLRVLRTWCMDFMRKALAESLRKREYRQSEHAQHAISARICRLQNVLGLGWLRYFQIGIARNCKVGRDKCCRQKWSSLPQSFDWVSSCCDLTFSQLFPIIIKHPCATYLYNS